MRLYSWEYILLFLPVLGYFFWQFHYKKNIKYHSTIKYPDINKLKKNITESWKLQLRKYLIMFKLAALFFLIIALARPQSGQRSEDSETKGIDIMLALDASGSMEAEDFKPYTRYAIAKHVLAEFIKHRKTDRIGLVSFAGESYTLAPLTLDYNILLEQIKYMKIGTLEDGTAIGMAIANCVNRLQYSKAKSKIIILATDGRNNRGEIDPITAAEVAATYNIKIYTVGIGSIQGAPIIVNHPQLGRVYMRNPDGSIMYWEPPDEETLNKIASITGGKYFRATDSDTMKKIFEKIDKLEKTKIVTKQYLQFTENFQPFLIIGLILLLAFIIIDNIILIKIP